MPTKYRLAISRYSARSNPKVAPMARISGFIEVSIACCLCLLYFSLVRFKAGEVPIATSRALVYANGNIHIFEHANIGGIEGFGLGFEEAFTIAGKLKPIHFVFT